MCIKVDRMPSDHEIKVLTEALFCEHLQTAKFNAKFHLLHLN